MGQAVFQDQKVELTFQDGLSKASRQTLANLKEEVTTDQVLQLSQLFGELAPVGMELTDTMTVKRMKHMAV